MKPCEHDSYPIYKKLIEPLRARARELGYALAVHGTLKRDIDLLACPWVEDCASAEDLAEALRVVAHKIHGHCMMKAVEYNDPWHLAGSPGDKPHGRLTWCFYFGGPSYLDLSVMPTEPPMATDEIVRRTTAAAKRSEQA